MNNVLKKLIEVVIFGATFIQAYGNNEVCAHACAILPQLEAPLAQQLSELILVAKVFEANEPQTNKRLAQLYKALNALQISAGSEAVDNKDMISRLQFLFVLKTIHFWMIARQWLKDSIEIIVVRLEKYGLSKEVLDFMEPKSEHTCEACRQVVMSNYQAAVAQGTNLGLAKLAAAAEEPDNDTEVVMNQLN